MENKPCPFCGSTDLDVQTQNEDREGFPCNVICVDCGATGPWSYTKDRKDTACAFEDWNKRV